MKNLMATVSNASRRLDALHELLRSLGSFIDEQTAMMLRILRSIRPELAALQSSDAGQSAAPALARSLPAIEPSPEQIKDGLNTIRDSYAHATEAIHALVAAFVRDRF